MLIETGKTSTQPDFRESGVHSRVGDFSPKTLLARMSARLVYVLARHSILAPLLRNAFLQELARDPADLIVLATHRRSGLDRWLHDEIANKISRYSRTLALFIPYGVNGFVAVDNGDSSLRRILLPVDSGPWPQASVDAASAMAEILGGDSVDFTLLHIGADEPAMPDLNLPEHLGWCWSRSVRDGDVVEQILSVADEQSSDLIVMTTQGHDGFLDALRGSTTERVLQSAQCPVLAVPTGWRRTVKR